MCWCRSGSSSCSAWSPSTGSRPACVSTEARRGRLSRGVRRDRPRAAAGRRKDEYRSYLRQQRVGGATGDVLAGTRLHPATNLLLPKNKPHVARGSLSPAQMRRRRGVVWRSRIPYLAASRGSTATWSCWRPSSSSTSRQLSCTASSCRRRRSPIHRRRRSGAWLLRMLRAKLRGRARRSGRTSFSSSLGGCACSRFFGPTAGSGKYCALLERVAAPWPGSNVCEGNPATRKAVAAMDLDLDSIRLRRLVRARSPHHSYRGRSARAVWSGSSQVGTWPHPSSSAMRAPGILARTCANWRDESKRSCVPEAIVTRLNRRAWAPSCRRRASLLARSVGRECQQPYSAAGRRLHAELRGQGFGHNRSSRCASVGRAGEAGPDQAVHVRDDGELRFRGGRTDHLEG